MERLNASDSSNELGAEGRIILKLVVHTQVYNLDIFDLLRTPPRTVGFLKIMRISLPEEELAASPKGHCCL